MGSPSEEIAGLKKRVSELESKLADVHTVVNGLVAVGTKKPKAVPDKDDAVKHE